MYALHIVQGMGRCSLSSLASRWRSDYPHEARGGSPPRPSAHRYRQVCDTPSAPICRRLPRSCWQHPLRESETRSPLTYTFACFNASVQIQLDVSVPFAHFDILRLADGQGIWRSAWRCCAAKSVSIFKYAPHFRQKFGVVGQRDDHLFPLPRHHGATSPRRLPPSYQGVKMRTPDIIILRRLIRAVVHRLIEREGIPPIERRIAVLLFGEDIFENHLGDLGD